MNTPCRNIFPPNVLAFLFVALTICLILIAWKCCVVTNIQLSAGLSITFPDWCWCGPVKLAKPNVNNTVETLLNGTAMECLFSMSPLDVWLIDFQTICKETIIKPAITKPYNIQKAHGVYTKLGKTETRKNHVVDVKMELSVKGFKIGFAHKCLIRQIINIQHLRSTQGKL